MRYIYNILIGATAVAAVGTAQSQTVQVSKTGAITTVQAAIASFAGDVDPAPNIIQITDSEVYDEAITVNVPVTIEGTGASKPRLTVNGNPNGKEGTAGLVVNLPGSVTTDTVVLRNLAIMPSLTDATAISAAVNVFNNNAFVFFDDVLITGNDGANNPISTDGKTNAGANASHKHFDGDIIVAGENDSTQVGTGVELLLRNTIITNNRGTGPRTDGILMVQPTAADYRKVRIEDGCVFSYISQLTDALLGYGITVTGDFELDAPNEPVIMTGMHYGIFFSGNSQNVRLVRGAVISQNERSAIYESSSDGVRMTVEDCIFANNLRTNVWMLGGATSPITFERVTVANQRSSTQRAMIIASTVSAPVTFTDCIIGGNGTNLPDNFINNEGPAIVTLENTAIVQAGVRRLLPASFANPANVIGTPITTADPMFINMTDVFAPTFYDVTNFAYYALASDGSPLVGGANYSGIGPVVEETVTVSKTSTADFTSIQAAIDSLPADPERRLRIEVLDASVYDEMITMDVPASIIGTGPQRPVLAVRSNPDGYDQDGSAASTAWSGDAGLLIHLPIDTFTTAKVELKNLVIIPSRNSTSGTPPVAGIVNKASNFYLEMENLLVTSNNGSDEPVNTDGMSDAGAVNTSFLVSGAHLGSITNNRPEGAGLEVRMRDCIFTNIRSTLGGTWRTGMYMYRTYYVYTFPTAAGTPTRPTAFRELTIDGKCIFSYNNGSGLRSAASMIINTPNDKSLFLNNSTEGLWMDMQVGPGNNKNIANGIIVAYNGTTGINEGVSSNGPRMTLQNSIIANNGSYGVYHRLGIAAQIDSRYIDVTVANNAQSLNVDHIQSSTATSHIDLIATDSILAGDGNTARANNRINWTSLGSITLENTAVVQEGPFTFTTPAITMNASATLVGSPITTADPMFVETVDVTNPNFYAVSNPAYGTLSSTGGPLTGGSVFAPASVNDWSVY